MVAVKKRNKKLQKSQKSYSIWIVVALISFFIALLFFVFGNKDSKVPDKLTGGSNEFQTIADACLGYAKGDFRAEFCKYYMLNDELINCKDSRVVEYIRTQGVEVDIPSLNCKAIDNFYYRKTACQTLASGRIETKIAGTTCNDYK